MKIKMNFKNIDIYNVAELVPCSEGVSWLRFPKETIDKMEGGENSVNVAKSATGVELRFVINSGDSAVIRMKKYENDSILNSFCIFRGGVQGGWQDADINNWVEDTPKDFTILRTKNISALKLIRRNDGFSPDVIRVVFNRGKYVILDVIGDVRPPREDEVPEKKILFYGSSITHGSNALGMAHSFASTIGRKLNCDVMNLGMAGQCRIENRTIHYISSLKWNAAVLELGINVLEWNEEKIYRQVNYAINNIARKYPNRFIVFVSPFFSDDDLYKKGRAEKWRKIMKDCIKQAELPNTLYVCGTDVLHDAQYLSSDELHPNIEGVNKIAEVLGNILSDKI